MADNGRWYKLWTRALDNNRLDRLDIADFSDWTQFCAYLKARNADRTITLTASAGTLCALLQVEDFNALVELIGKFPNCVVNVVKE